MLDQEFLKIVKSSVKGYTEKEEVITKFYDTGSYILNAAISGSIYGGVPHNKITTLAGEQATGKTFFAMSIVKNFLKENPEGSVLYFDTEQAINKDFFKDRDIPTENIHVIRTQIVEHVKTQIIKILDAYKLQKKRKPLMIVLDSLGNLTTIKEYEDSLAEKHVLDMTRARMIKSMFRVITEPLGLLGVPFIVTNHTYDDINSWGGGKKMGGGSGTYYNSSTILMLSKAKDRDAKDKKTVNGIIVRANIEKSRLTHAFKTVESRIDFSEGLDRYYGLFDLAVKHKVFEKTPSSAYIHPEFPDRKLSMPDILRDPVKFFSKAILDKIDAKCAEEFKLGSSAQIEQEEAEKKELEKIEQETKDVTVAEESQVMMPANLKEES